MLLQASNPELKKLLIISIAVMVLLALAIILFVLFYQRRVIRHQQEIKRINDQKQLELTQAALQGEEEEKMRIASELHDDVGATLSTIKRYFTAALNTQNNNNTEIAAEANALLDSSIDKVRNISHTLQPAFLQQLGLQAALESFAELISKPGNIKMMAVCSATLPRFADSTELAVYRMVQELTTNTLRYANATEISVGVFVQQEQLCVLFNHDGNGLTQTQFLAYLSSKGTGLKNIINRMKSVNGAIHFSQDESNQYQVSIQIPMASQNQNQLS